MSGFDLSKTVDTSRSVVINYLPLGITSIFRDDVNQYITADCAISSSSNKYSSDPSTRALYAITSTSKKNKTELKNGLKNSF